MFSISPSHLRVRPMGCTCRREGEIATKYPPKVFYPCAGTQTAAALIESGEACKMAMNGTAQEIIPAGHHATTPGNPDNPEDNASLLCCPAPFPCL